jgi:hypothetical protein
MNIFSRLRSSSSESPLLSFHAACNSAFTSCGHFMSIIMGDYVAGFLGSSEGCTWNMNAFDVGEYS